MSVLKTGHYPRSLIHGEWKLMDNPYPPFQPVEDYELLEGEPGDVVIFDNYVPHGSPGNCSDKRRRNIFLTVNGEADGDMRERYYADKFKSYPPNQAREEGKTYEYKV